ncbi:MAG: succinate dehydrogenase/fumarate reductase iron-sulfur subunit [Rectinemataceae bacterium]
MDFKLRVWRQKNRGDKGRFETYEATGISSEASVLEMLDVVNRGLVAVGKDAIAFDHDCREGICGSCGMVINGGVHGPFEHNTTCELRMRRFSDGDTITIEPFRVRAFPIIKDLVVDRTAFDRIMQAGGYVTVKTGQAPEANNIAVPKKIADEAMDAAQCVGCGACAATCPNGSAMLFVAAKVSQLALLPQGKAERKERVLSMVAQMDKEGFGACSNSYACEAKCPKSVSVSHIARMNREFIGAGFGS